MELLYVLFLVLFLTEYAELPGQSGFFSQALRQGEIVKDFENFGFLIPMMPADPKSADLCTGFFASEEIFVTPAQCLFEAYKPGGPPPKLLKKVYLLINTPGFVDMSDKIELEINKFEFYHEFEHESLKHDIARYVFKEKPKMKYRLYHRDVVGSDYLLNKPMSEHLTIYGYAAETDEETAYLKQCDVSYIDGEKCKKFFYEDVIVDGLMCIWPYNNGTDYEHALRGDSGATLIEKIDNKIVGMVKAGADNKPDFFTPLANYHHFIYHGNLNPNQSTGKHSPELGKK